MGRAWKNSIAVRLGTVVGLLLIALAITNVIAIRQMDENAGRVITATGLFDQLEAASGANRAFGTLRYWLTDLAVSQLTHCLQVASRADSAEMYVVGTGFRG